MADRYDLNAVMNAAIKSAQSDTIRRKARGDLVGGIALDPITTVLAPSDTVQVTGHTSNQAPLSVLAGIVWDSSDNAVATVNSSGLVTAVADGTARITADGGGAVGFVDVTVFDTVPASVTVTPPTVTLAALATQQAVAVVKNQFGATLTSETVTWDSSDDAKATVSVAGLITAVATGSATVTATSDTDGGLTDTCVVTVS